MPITMSAKKALRGSLKKRRFNQLNKEKLNKAFKKVKKLIADKKAKEAKAFMSEVQSVLDKSVKNGLIKKNNASRKKARISAMIKNIK